MHDRVAPSSTISSASDPISGKGLIIIISVHVRVIRVEESFGSPITTTSNEKLFVDQSSLTWSCPVRQVGAGPIAPSLVALIHPGQAGSFQTTSVAIVGGYAHKVIPVDQGCTEAISRLRNAHVTIQEVFHHDVLVPVLYLSSGRERTCSTVGNPRQTFNDHALHVMQHDIGTRPNTPQRHVCGLAVGGRRIGESMSAQLKYLPCNIAIPPPSASEVSKSYRSVSL